MVKTQQTCYIAGPMRGYPFQNHPAFDNAQQKLVSEGWHVLSPANISRELRKQRGVSDFSEIPMVDFVRADTDAIIRSDAIYMLRGWENSVGARAEFALAVWLGLKIMYEAELT